MLFSSSPGEARVLRSARRAKTALQLIDIRQRECCNQIRIGDLLTKMLPVSVTHMHVACEPDERACDVMRVWKTPSCALPGNICEEILRSADQLGSMKETRWEQSKHRAANTVWQLSVNTGQTEDTLQVRQPLMAYAWAIVYNVIDPLIQAKYGVRVNPGRWSDDPYSTAGLKDACNDIFISRYDAHVHAHGSGRSAQAPQAFSGIEYHRDGQDFACVSGLAE